MGGIAGVFSNEKTSLKTHFGLFQVHHRGQGSAGITTAGDKSIRTYIGNGRVEAVFPKELLNILSVPSDYASIGHVGTEKGNVKYVSPLEINYTDFDISVSMNGIILNRDEVDGKNGFETEDDKELFGRTFYKHLKESGSIKEATRHTMKDLSNAYYSLIMIIRDKKNGEAKLLGVRDARGVRPMYFGTNGDDFLIGSESGMIDGLERIGEVKMTERRDVNPGEMIIASKDGCHTEQLMPPNPKHCAFEWVYTARPDSVMNGINSHDVRKKLGESLVRLHDIKNDGNSVVVGIPDSGRSVALGISSASGIPFDEGIIKNQYVGRTYIINVPNKRKDYASMKHNAIKSVIEGKRVIIGDDSIVRGTISEAVSSILKDAGAKHIDFAVSYAPIFYRCFEDEPNKPLAAAGLEGMDIYEIGKKVAEGLPSIDNVLFNDVESVVNAIGISKDKLCTRCISGIDPFK